MVAKHLFDPKKLKKLFFKNMKHDIGYKNLQIARNVTFENFIFQVIGRNVKFMELTSRRYAIGRLKNGFHALKQAERQLDRYNHCLVDMGSQGMVCQLMGKHVCFRFRKKICYYKLEYLSTTKKLGKLF